MENLLNGAGSLPQRGAVLQQFCIAAVVGPPTPPESGFSSGDSAFVVLIPGIRILQPPGHSFCAKLILSSVFFAALGSPEAAKK